MRAQVASALLLVLVSCGPAVAQQVAPVQQAARPEAQMIYIGQSLDNVATVLKQRGIEFHEGGFAFAKGDPDRSNLIFTLDENHTWVCAFFSKSKRAITGLSLVFFPSRVGHDKGSESWVAATDLALYPDTTYAVRFAKPLTHEQLREREASRPASVSPAPPASR